MNEYKIGQFGHSRFQVKKKGKPTTGFNGYGTIIEIESNVILFRDNDGFEFIVRKADFNFESEEFVEK